jgi:hypothetical protein
MRRRTALASRASPAAQTSQTERRFIMQSIKRWFGWTAVIGPIHICEQLLFGIDQVDELKGFADSYYAIGAATAIPFVIFGVLLSRELVREFRKNSAPAVEVAYQQA